MKIYRACFETNVGEYSHADYLLVAAEDLDSATKHFEQELSGWWGEETQMNGKEESWNGYTYMVTRISWINEISREVIPNVDGELLYEIEYVIKKK